MDGMLKGARLDGPASMSELLAMLLQVGLQLGHILALEDVPHRPCAPVSAHSPKHYFDIWIFDDHNVTTGELSATVKL